MTRFRPMAFEHAMIDEAIVDVRLNYMVASDRLSRRPYPNELDC